MKTHLRFPIFAIVICFLLPVTGFSDEAELSERATIDHEVIMAVQKQDFSKLEALADAYRNSQARTTSGLWKLTLFYSAIKANFDTRIKDDAFWTSQEQWLNDWLGHYPKSPAARLAYADMLISRGWSIRGDGYADTVEPRNWKPFNEYIQKARDYLETYKALAAKDPYWYQLMAIVAKAQSWPDEAFSKLIGEGLKRHPLFYEIYFAAIINYLPKWGGNPALIEKFATDAVKKTQASEGFGMYTRIYWVVAQNHYQNRLFTHTLVDWQVMKKGMDDILKKYPDSWNINNFAFFSCLAGDKAKAAELINRIAMPSKGGWWGDLDYFQRCRDWALAK